jgi:hypothetical protein
MSVLAILTAVAIILWACSPALAVLIGKSIRLADERTPTAPTTAVKAGEAPTCRRGAHLRLVP